MARRRSTGTSGEDRLIARHFRPLATHPGALALVDDAAVLAIPAGHDLVLKTDAVIAGVHFFADDPPEAVARKALRINLSDLAGKGARPLGFLGADARKYGCPLLGGDTDRTPGLLTVTVAAFGTVPRGTMVLRGGARAGDRIVVTGTIGDAALGVILRRSERAAKRWGLDRRMREHLLRRYLVPEPRNAAAEALRRHANGGMDISDGLAGDLAKMCRASRVDARVDVAQLPLSAAARAALAADPRLIEPILTGGDDYEILASVPPRKLESLRRAAKAAGVRITEIGRMTKGRGKAHLIGADGRELKFRRPSYSHF